MPPRVPQSPNIPALPAPVDQAQSPWPTFDLSTAVRRDITSGNLSTASLGAPPGTVLTDASKLQPAAVNPPRSAPPRQTQQVSPPVTQPAQGAVRSTAQGTNLPPPPIATGTPIQQSVLQPPVGVPSSPGNIQTPHNRPVRSTTNLLQNAQQQSPYASPQRSTGNTSTSSSSSTTSSSTSSAPSSNTTTSSSASDNSSSSADSLYGPVNGPGPPWYSAVNSQRKVRLLASNAGRFAVVALIASIVSLLAFSTGIAAGISPLDTGVLFSGVLLDGITGTLALLARSATTAISSKVQPLAGWSIALGSILGLAEIVRLLVWH